MKFRNFLNAFIFLSAAAAERIAIGDLTADATVSYDGSTVTFSVSSKTAAWLSFGVSKSGLMAGAGSDCSDVFLCSEHKNGQFALTRHCLTQYVAVTDFAIYSDGSCSVADGKSHMTVTRAITAEDGEQPVNLDANTHFIGAWGTLTRKGLEYHGQGAATSKLVKLATPGIEPTSHDAHGFGAYIEGAAFDTQGNFYAVHYRNSIVSTKVGNDAAGANVIGKIKRDTMDTGVFYDGSTDFPNAAFNGIRFHPDGKTVYLADKNNKRVIKVDIATKKGTVACSSNEMVPGAPNDLALANNGILYLSGQEWNDQTGGSGGLYMCKPGVTQALVIENNMKRTNGIALSPDDTILYLSEADGSPVADAAGDGKQVIYKYSIVDNIPVGKTKFYDFNDGTSSTAVDTDGMRCDMEGNLYVTRHNGASVVKISPTGVLLQTYNLENMKAPTNLEFGGDDGKTVFVVGRCGETGWGEGDGCVEKFRVASPGRQWGAVFGQFTADVSEIKGFGAYIEGAAFDKEGNFYAVHYRNTEDATKDGNDVGSNVIGVLKQGSSKSEVWYTHPDTTAAFNGIRFHRGGKIAYLADKNNKQVIKVNMETMTGSKFCGGDIMVPGAPNDMALAKNGNLYLSGQEWNEATGGSGGIWMCQPNGLLLDLTPPGGMKRTNGIALSPDDKYLYVSEADGSPVNENAANRQVIWKYTVAQGGRLQQKEKFFDFAKDSATETATIDSDGMRCDMQGNLYVTRHGGHKVVKISPWGRHLSTMNLDMQAPTNLEFGGPDGKLLYVVGRCGTSNWGEGDGCIESFEVDVQGRQWDAYFGFGSGQTVRHPCNPTGKNKFNGYCSDIPQNTKSKCEAHAILLPAYDGLNPCIWSNGQCSINQKCKGKMIATMAPSMPTGSPTLRPTDTDAPTPMPTTSPSPAHDDKGNFPGTFSDILWEGGFEKEPAEEDYEAIGKSIYNGKRYSRPKTAGKNFTALCGEKMLSLRLTHHDFLHKKNKIAFGFSPADLEEGNTQAGTTRYFGWAMSAQEKGLQKLTYTILDWEPITADGDDTIMAFKGGVNGTFVYTGLAGKEFPTTEIKMEPLKWNTFVLGVHWSSDPSKGWIQLWHEGKVVLPKQLMGTMPSDDSSVRINVGLERDQADTRATGILYDCMVYAKGYEEPKEDTTGGGGNGGGDDTPSGASSVFSSSMSVLVLSLVAWLM